MPSKIKTCEDYRAALTDAIAAAAEPSFELRSHLDACPTCRAASAEETKLFAAIDTGLRATANVEMPASLLPRVRAELNERPVLRHSWVLAGAAMAAAALVAVIVFVRGFERDMVPTNPQVISAAHNIPSPGIRPAPPAVAPNETAGLVEKHRQMRAVKTAPLAASAVAEVAVLVPAGKKQAMDALLAGVRQGQVQAEVLLAEKSEKTLEELQVSPLDISPITVNPLADVSPGSASESEKIRR
jgi:anti-sigma factor RsiW